MTLNPASGNGMNEQQPLSTEDIDALLRFLPILVADGFGFGEWESQEGTFPHFNFSAEADRFHLRLIPTDRTIGLDRGQRRASDDVAG